MSDVHSPDVQTPAFSQPGSVGVKHAVLSGTDSVVHMPLKQVPVVHWEIEPVEHVVVSGR